MLSQSVEPVCLLQLALSAHGFTQPMLEYLQSKLQQAYRHCRLAELANRVRVPKGAALQNCRNWPNVLVSRQPLVFTRETQRIWNGARCPVPNLLSFPGEHQWLLRYSCAFLLNFTEVLHLLGAGPYVCTNHSHIHLPSCPANTAYSQLYPST